jgi:hypothetical protein
MAVITLQASAHSSISVHSLHCNKFRPAGFEAFTAVTLKNAAFFDVALCVSCNLLDITSEFHIVSIFTSITADMN